jgi:hypothetical protein
VLSSKDAPKDNRVLPLFGRQTYPHSIRYNYYAVLGNGVRLPLSMGGKACEASLGCPEIYDGDEVVVDHLDATYKVDLYEDRR